MKKVSNPAPPRKRIEPPPMPPAPPKKALDAYRQGFIAGHKKGVEEATKLLLGEGEGEPVGFFGSGE